MITRPVLAPSAHHSDPGRLPAAGPCVRLRADRPGWADVGTGLFAGLPGRGRGGRPAGVRGAARDTPDVVMARMADQEHPSSPARPARMARAAAHTRQRRAAWYVRSDAHLKPCVRSGRPGPGRAAASLAGFALWAAGRAGTIFMHNAECSLALPRRCRRSPQRIFYRPGRKSDRRFSAVLIRLGSHGTSAPIDPFWVGSGEHALLVAAIECDVAGLLSLAGQAGSIR